MERTRYQNLRLAVWTTWIPSASVVCVVGAHILAASLGLYSSAPDVTVVRPVTGTSIEGQTEIAVRADDGPTGSGVRSVEYQIDSTSGAWTPLLLDPESMIYKGRWASAGVSEGNHELYVRATDFTGNLRTVYITVNVAQPPADPTRKPVLTPSSDETFSWKATGALQVQARKAPPRD